MASNAKAGDTYFELKIGKKAGPFRATYNIDKDKQEDYSYLDVVKGGSRYPTKLDFEKFHTVTGISFKDDVGGKETKWSSWIYWNHKDWEVDRFASLS